LDVAIACAQAERLHPLPRYHPDLVGGHSILSETYTPGRGGHRYRVICTCKVEFRAGPEPALEDAKERAYEKWRAHVRLVEGPGGFDRPL
jgi:hypothetical protein